MPRFYKKKRGKYDKIREERKEKRNEIARQNAKRRKLANGEAISVDLAENETTPFEQGDDFIGLDDDQYQEQPQQEPVFYGLLDAEEQAYYANINNKILANDFESDEERKAFIEAVHRESKGKELKLASSQSCSRHLEKIIRLSNEDQLRNLFVAISPGLTQLVQHRFGSHVCETLFEEAAKYVTAEDRTQRSDKDTLEKQFLQAAATLKPDIGFMITDRFASHVLRVLLLVLAGEPLDDMQNKAVLGSKKKEDADLEVSHDEPAPTRGRKTPQIFEEATCDLIAAAASTLDATSLRALATHPTGNPVLQILLKLELTRSDKGRRLDNKSLFKQLVSTEELDEGSESKKFVMGLTYDPTGSHLVEILIQHAPGKPFKKLYKNVWKDRLSSMARNETASYVAIRILERLGRDDLAEAQEGILAELPFLWERRRYAVVRTLIERCLVRGTSLQPLADAMRNAAGGDKVKIVSALLHDGKPTQTAARKHVFEEQPPREANGVHGSLLAQTMLQAPFVSTLIHDGLLILDTDVLLQMACRPADSRLLQTALTSSQTPVSLQKCLIPAFYGHTVELATNAAGSYLIDALWQATAGMHFMKERIAAEMAAQEGEMRGSSSGRKVWRNWSMDLYLRRRGEWQAVAKGDSHQLPSSKTSIQLAQERYLKRNGKKSRDGGEAIRTVAAHA